MHVTVALFGAPIAPFTGDLPVQDADLLYEERLAIELDTQPGETLGEIIDRAAARLGIDLDRSFEVLADARVSDITFGISFDEAGEGWPRWHRELDLVNEDGLVQFAVPWQEATLDALERTTGAGLMRGDPSRLLWQPGPEGGNGPPSEWADFLAALVAAWAVLKILAEAHGVFEMLNKLRQRLQRAEPALEQRYIEWSSRGARPHNLAGFLHEHDWTPAQLARFLGCDESEAEAVLWAFGFAYDDAAQKWVYAADTASAAVGDVAEIAMSDIAQLLNEDALRRLVEERIDALIKRGELPEYPWAQSEHWIFDELTRAHDPPD